MRFAIDAHAVGQHLTGNEVYVRNLLDQFAAMDEARHLVAYVCDKPAVAELPPNIEKRFVANNPFIRLGWNIPRLLRQEPPLLLHVQYTGPIACRVPLIVSVHDVSYLQYPQYFSFLRRQQLKATVRRTVHQAVRILCPSDFSRRSIIDAYGVSPERVIVMPNGVSSAFQPIQKEPAAEHIRAQYGIRHPFILMVGDLQPRKNHLGMLKAFGELIRAVPELPHHLVFVGKETWFSPTVHRAVETCGFADRVHITGFVEDSDLIDFYGAADVVVYPSFYEGFGLPIIEAMACGRAVACSNTTAMPEVAGGAALLFDPENAGEIAMSLRELLVNPALRTRMERLGLQRAGHFSWERTASRTMDVYYEVAGGKRPVRSVRRDPVPASLR